MSEPELDRPFPLLRAGQRFRLHPDCGVASIFQVLHVSDCSATVRALATTHVVIPGPGGEPIAEFWRPGRILQISPRPSVILLPPEQQTPHPLPTTEKAPPRCVGCNRETAQDDIVDSVGTSILCRDCGTADCTGAALRE